MVRQRHEVRDRFPALDGPDALLDNAGGSQMPADAIEAAHRYMTQCFVQLGADYATSRQASAIMDQAHRLARMVVGDDGRGQVILGPSTSCLVAMLADCYRRAFDPRRPEVIVAESGHEANVGPWVRLEREGWKPVFWKLDPSNCLCPVETLRSLVSERTRIVAFPHVSNLLGSIEDVAEITRIAHSAGARVVVDGVAYAPHRAIDAAAWNVDWYVFSTYKVYGPHMAAMYGTREAMSQLEGPNHYFISRDEGPYKFELGGLLHEGCAAWVGTGAYLGWLAGRETDAALDRSAVIEAFEQMTALEEPLQRTLLEWLAARQDITLFGPAASSPLRVPTFSFVHKSMSSRQIAQAANAAGLGIRFGHYYAHRLCKALGLDPEDGVVRVSLVHYNSPEEVQRLISFLHEYMSGG
ncbi:MAG: aminotransferase class V-fold PLP-dependent enzyme [Deltaproteobacteria bacterium]|nr:aminotransferase class V-fold PLP-dependent enzyme [Deltaproteobacteria bacterium]